MRNKIIGTAAAIAFATGAFAQVTLLEQSFSEQQGTGLTFNYTVAGATSDSVLLFGFYGDGNDGNVTSGQFSLDAGDPGSIGGMIIGDRSALGYISNVDTGDTFNLSTPDAGFGTGYSGVWFAVLNGVDTSNPIFDSSVFSPNGEPVAPLPTIDRAADGYVFQFSSNNRNGQTPEYTGSDLTGIANSTGGGGTHTGSYDVAIASIAGTSAGTFTLNGSNWSSTNERNNDELAYSFNAIPEPSTFVLMGVALGATLLFRRRKR